MEGDGSESCAIDVIGGLSGVGVGVVVGDGVEKKNTPEVDPKPKRKAKTPAQLEILEKTYATDPFPSEGLRAELSVKLGLSDRQLQMWFCHRRVKDRKATAEKRVTKDSSVVNMSGLVGGAGEDLSAAHNVELGSDLSLAPGTSTVPKVETHLQHRVVHRPGTALARIRKEKPSVKRHYKAAKAMSELKAVSFVEAQLGEHLREDGPILGMEFDPLPPGAFGIPVVGTQHKKPVPQLHEAPSVESPKAKVIKGTTKMVHEYQFLPERPCIRDDIHDKAASSHSLGSSYDLLNSRTSMFSGELFMLGREELMPRDTFQGQMPGHQGSILLQHGKQGQHTPLALREVEIASQRTPFSNSDVDANCAAYPITGLENPFMSESQVIERKRKFEEARIAREIEANEKRIRKELEKQDFLRRKREEQMMKEMERQDKERRKEEERLLRERQREQERLEREQRREMERREKFLQKESLRAERIRLKEKARIEKETARLKAANDRATSRRVSKEPAELMDDDYVELMEIAASSLGLPSVQALDCEDLHNHEALKDSLSDFPPPTVHLKRPFAFRPWTDSEERVGCLLMVWKFLITFADVLGLWPFTLDEIVQAFHDHDSRLLGEIHIALLKTIIKDIEDVARTPNNVLGTHPNLAAKHGGGHPQIVEGAYAWGFDIQSWKQHLNPLTWPEIMRQFALSAGLGPKCKARSMEHIDIPDEHEGRDALKVISGLRNGAAAENAFARMRRRGLNNFRKSWHRLTPGTVKYAAFHILSLEGANGLTILEVAEKIQRSGLRDLNTSKTPEASISAALSRDTKLFERTAPSTYCVRSPYRKDPADADVSLATALEKVQVCKNEEADDLEKEDVERDEDSDCDLGEDVDVDNLGTELKPDNEAPLSTDARLKNDIFNCDKIELHSILNGSDVEPEGLIEEDDDTNSGELWVHGLMEGEYGDLCVDERLDALSALIGVVNEGNSVRAVLEERLEAATTLRKQLLAEAHFDKRRIKEEFLLKPLYSNIGGSRVEPALSANSLDSRQNHNEAVHELNGHPAPTPVDQHESFVASDPAEKNVQALDGCSTEFILSQQSAYAAERARSAAKYYAGHKAEEVYVCNSLPIGQDRRRNKYWQFMSSPSRYDPGAGKIFVELRDGCWKIIDSVEDFDALVAALDVRGIREFQLNLMLRKIEFSFKNAFEKNSSLFGYDKKENVKREGSKECPTSSICDWQPGAVEVSGSNGEKYMALKQYRHFEKWLWEECFNCRVLRALNYGETRHDRLLGVCDHCYELHFLKDHHCPFCHKNYSSVVVTFCFPDHINECKEIMKKAYDKTSQNLESSAPLRIRLLKAQLATLEASVPPEAREYFWSEDFRISWTTKLQSASSAEDLLQMLIALEGMIKREFLKEDYETTNELIGSDNANPSTPDTVRCLELVTVPPWVPLTTSAVALKLMELDASISYTLCQDESSQREKKPGNIFTTPQRAVNVKKNSQFRSSGGNAQRSTNKTSKKNKLQRRPARGYGSKRSGAKAKQKHMKVAAVEEEKADERSSSYLKAHSSHSTPVPYLQQELDEETPGTSYGVMETDLDNSKHDMINHDDYGTAEDSGNEDEEEADPNGDEKDENWGEDYANEGINGFKKMATGRRNDVWEYSSSDYSE